MVQARAPGSPAPTWTQQILNTCSPREVWDGGAAGRRGLRDAQLAALLPGSGEGKQCSRYQTPPAPEGKRVRVQGGGQDPGTDGQALTHWWGGLRPPTEGSWNSIGQSCGSRRSSAQAFAERQCRLVAGGAHTRLLRDGPAHHPECS